VVAIIFGYSKINIQGGIQSKKISDLNNHELREQYNILSRTPG
jgi:hypothetical protein